MKFQAYTRSTVHNERNYNDDKTKQAFKERGKMEKKKLKKK